MSGYVLVVDDVLSNVMLLEGRLTAAGFEVATAYSGLECLAKLANDRPSLILLDVMMPGLDGTEVCRRIKANPTTADVPVILVTALSQEQANDAVASAGADGYLVKPIGDEDLVACLAKYIPSQ
jgi:two-component system cell cycle response regulator